MKRHRNILLFHIDQSLKNAVAMHEEDDFHAVYAYLYLLLFDNGPYAVKYGWQLSAFCANCDFKIR